MGSALSASHGHVVATDEAVLFTSVCRHRVAVSRLTQSVIRQNGERLRDFL